MPGFAGVPGRSGGNDIMRARFDPRRSRWPAWNRAAQLRTIQVGAAILRIERAIGETDCTVLADRRDEHDTPFDITTPALSMK